MIPCDYHQKTSDMNLTEYLTVLIIKYNFHTFVCAFKLRLSTIKSKLKQEEQYNM